MASAHSSWGLRWSWSIAHPRTAPLRVSIPASRTNKVRPSPSKPRTNPSTVVIIMSVNANGNALADETREDLTEFEEAQMAHMAVMEEYARRMAEAMEAVATLATRAQKSRWLR